MDNTRLGTIVAVALQFAALMFSAAYTSIQAVKHRSLGDRGDYR